MVNFDLGQVGEVFRRKDKGAIVSGDNPEEEEDVDASEFEEDEVKPVRTKNRRPKRGCIHSTKISGYKPGVNAEDSFASLSVNCCCICYCRRVHISTELQSG